MHPVPEFGSGMTGRLRYATTPLAIVNLLAIFPFYPPMFIPIDLRFFRVLRLFRLTRILKLSRYSEAVKTFNRVLNKKKEELIIAIFILFIVIVMASGLMYYAEHDVLPEKFADISHAMWWSVVTLLLLAMAIYIR